MESRSRSLAKAFSYRFVGSVSTAAVIYVLTLDVALSAGGGALDAGVKIVLYFIHERLWSRIPFGREKGQEFQG